MILRRLVDRMNQNVSAPTGVFRGHCKWCYMSATTTEETHYKDCVLAELESIANGDAPPADAQPQATATKIECKHGCGQPLDQHYVERQFKDGRETYSAVKCPISPSDDYSSSRTKEGVEFRVEVVDGKEIDALWRVVEAARSLRQAWGF